MPDQFLGLRREPVQGLGVVLQQGDAKHVLHVRRLAVVVGRNNGGWCPAVRCVWIIILCYYCKSQSTGLRSGLWQNLASQVPTIAVAGTHANVLDFVVVVVGVASSSRVTMIRAGLADARG